MWQQVRGGEYLKKCVVGGATVLEDRAVLRGTQDSA